jgi:hypothetical protein
MSLNHIYIYLFILLILHIIKIIYHNDFTNIGY